MKGFKYWTYDEVETTFSLTCIFRNYPLLDAWLDVKPAFSATEIAQITALSDKLLRNRLNWNEEELKIFFIAHLIEWIDFEMTPLRAFMDRPLSIKINDKNAIGKVDFMVAKGKKKPEQPYFFLHEYKQENNQSEDPLGQLLIAMVAAQHQNAEKFPLYGCYVVGRNWFFVLLNGTEYAVSKSYDAAEPIILQDILAILQKIKTMLPQFLQKQ
jgi:hypothetical protein